MNTEAARALVEAAWRQASSCWTYGGPRAAPLLRDEVWEEVPVASAEEAVAAAEDLGWPVALKATAEHLRHRIDLGGVRLELTQPGDLRVSYHVMVARLGEDADLVVQAMAPPGVATVIASKEDAAFGPLVSFGLGGVATDLLGDQAWRAVPLTDSDASELVREPRAAPLLFGYRGAAPVDVAGVEDVLLRVARLADDLPEVAETRAQSRRRVGEGPGRSRRRCPGRSAGAPGHRAAAHVGGRAPALRLGGSSSGRSRRAALRLRRH